MSQRVDVGACANLPAAAQSAIDLDQALADLANDLPVDNNLGLADSLNTGSHGLEIKREIQDVG